MLHHVAVVVSGMELDGLWSFKFLKVEKVEVLSKQEANLAVHYGLFSVPTKTWVQMRLVQGAVW